MLTAVWMHFLNESCNHSTDSPFPDTSFFLFSLAPINTRTHDPTSMSTSEGLSTGKSGDSRSHH
jgi:hypothetical protein